jgi:hypothetical protein
MVGDTSKQTGPNVRDKGITGAAAVEDLNATFASAELRAPPVPKRFVPTLAFQHEWLWTTRPVHSLDMYMFDRYPNEILMETAEGGDVADYFAVSHGGHGVNSYFLTYQLVTRRLAVFVQVGWGGGYMDAERSRQAVAVAYDGITSLLSKAGPLLEADAAFGPRLVVLASPSRGVGVAEWLEHKLPDRQARRTWIDEHACEPSMVTARARGLLQAPPSGS